MGHVFYVGSHECLPLPVARGICHRFQDGGVSPPCQTEWAVCSQRAGLGDPSQPGRG